MFVFCGLSPYGVRPESGKPLLNSKGITILAGDKNMKINLSTVMKISLNFSDHENIFNIFSKIASQDNSDVHPVPSAHSRAATIIVSVFAPESPALSPFYLFRPHTAPHHHCDQLPNQTDTRDKLRIH